MRLKQNHRRFFKKPLGKLLGARAALKAAKNSLFFVSVGDASTEFFVSNKIVPDVAVVDYLEKRIPLAASRAKKIPKEFDFVLRAKNPAGTLSRQAVKIVEKAFSIALQRGKKAGAGKKVLVEIDGEEDLVFLPAALSAPENSLLFYGQPGKGIVEFRATAEAKKRVKKLVGKAFE